MAEVCIVFYYSQDSVQTPCFTDITDAQHDEYNLCFGWFKLAPGKPLCLGSHTNQSVMFPVSLIVPPLEVSINLECKFSCLKI